MKLSFKGYNTKVPLGMKTMYVDQYFDLQNIRTVNECPCCNSTFVEALSIQSKNEKVPSLSRGYCTKCGYFGAKRTLSENWIENYYLKEWTNTELINQTEMNSDLKNERPFNLITKYLKDKNARILDAGAGYGSSLKVFIENGYSNIEALELSTRRSKILETRYKVKVDNIPLESLAESKILSKKYNAVYLWHVFEHLTKLKECMASLSTAIENDGLLYIAVPDFMEEHSTNLVNLHVHMHTFQNFTLHHLMAQYGFELVEEIVNFDGGGIRVIYRKKASTPLPYQLPDQQVIYNNYNEKIFKDFQLMFLVHQKECKRKNIILTFNYNSSFAGTTFIKYPAFALEYAFIKFATTVCDCFADKTFLKKIFTKISSRASRWFGFSLATIFFKSIEGMPEDQYPFREIFNQKDLLTIDFIHSENSIKLWME